MPVEFKRVPAVDKCFAILELLARTKQPLGISEISKQLSLNKSTVFNLIHTLNDLNVLENGTGGKFRFGTLLFTLGNAAGKRSELIQTVHPYLEAISRKTKLSAFLGIRSGMSAIIVDKVDSTLDIKISSEVGMRLPLLAGSGGKALLSLLPDEDIDRILARAELTKFTRLTNTDKLDFKKEIEKTRMQGVAYDIEEYIEGVAALAVPIKANRPDLQAAVWAVGLKQQLFPEALSEFSGFIKDMANEINQRFAPAT